MEKELKPKQGVRKGTRDLAFSKLKTAVNRILLVGIDNLGERSQLSAAAQQLSAAVRGCYPSVIGEFPDQEWEVARPVFEQASALRVEIMSKLKELYPNG